MGTPLAHLFSVRPFCQSFAEEEDIMMQKHGQPPDDVSSAPESGTVRDDTSGNAPSDRGCNPGQAASRDNTQEKDDPSIASEER
jgi:hypothetical protein